jgi:cytochrome c-type biogenesis protein
LCQNDRVAQFIVAFATGVLSFASPCVLPVLPGYVGYLAEGDAARAPARAALFVLGFSAVFVGMGAAAGAVGRLLVTYRVFLQQVGGLLITVFGLQMLGILGGGFGGVARAPRGRGALRALLAGSAFAVGFSPCIGPVLASLLLLAGQAATVWRGSALLAVYALGLGLPLLAVAFGVDGLRRALGRMPAVERVAGALLVAVGLLVYFGGFGRLGGLWGA